MFPAYDSCCETKLGQLTIIMDINSNFPPWLLNMSLEPACLASEFESSLLSGGWFWQNSVNV